MSKQYLSIVENIIIIVFNEKWVCACYGSVDRECPCNAGDTWDVGLIPGSGRSLRGGKCNPLQYSCLKNPKGRGAWQAVVQRVAKSWTRLRTELVCTTSQILKSEQTSAPSVPIPYSFPCSTIYVSQKSLKILLHRDMTFLEKKVVRTESETKELPQASSRN